MDKEGLHYPYYPHEELQIKELHYQYNKEFVAFSATQLKNLDEEKIRNLEYWINEVVDD